ncbi:MAG TPA: hypothetical protein VGE51_09110 [Fontimonas sp.]
MSAESDQRQADLENAERELQRYLGGDSPLSTKYRALSRESTPPQLDSAVLAHAQEQLQSAFATHRSQALRRRHRRWTIPLATAATMLVGVNLVWQLRDQAVPEIASGAAVERRPSAAPLSAPAPAVAPDVDFESAPQSVYGSEIDAAPAPAAVAEAVPAPQGEQPAQYDEARAAAQAGELQIAKEESRPRAEPAPAAPAESLADAMGAAQPSRPAPVTQSQTLEQTASAAKAKRAQGEAEQRRQVERSAPQALQRADNAAEPRERKAMAAASGFTAAAPPAAAAMAPAVVDDPAQRMARLLLRDLRMQDVAAVRVEFNAADLGSDMLNAAASTAAALGSDARVASATSGDGLWRFDYRDASNTLRMTAMLQQSGSEWTLLRIDCIDGP